MAEAFQVCDTIKTDDPAEMYVMKAYDFSKGKSYAFLLCIDRRGIECLL